MEAWEKAFRDYIAPQFLPATLMQLRDAIWMDDERLVQGTVCMSRECSQDDQAEAYYACPIGYMSMCEWEIGCNGTVQDAYAEVCRRVNESSGTPAAAYSFLLFVDKTSLTVVKAELLRVLNDIIDNTPTEVISNG